MAASSSDFIDVVAADRDLVVRRAGEHHCRLEPRDAGALTWFCELDDGTPTADDRDPASYVRWVCPALRTRTTAGDGAGDGAGAPLEVSRPGPHSDLGRLVKGFGRLAERVAGRTSAPERPGRFVYTDPAGILDPPLRQRIESWPPARHGDGVVRPAELWSIKTTREGLVVESVSWWDSAPALDHQIGLADDIALRMSTQG